MNNPPQNIVVSFKEANNRLKSAFIDQPLPALPFSWVAHVVFDSIAKHGAKAVATDEIQVMCWEITENWYRSVEFTDNEEFFTVADIVAMIQYRVTQYQQDIENTLNVWGILEGDKLKYQLKDFINEEDAIFVRVGSLGY